MKYLVIIFLLSIQCQLFGQNYFKSDSIPVENGKVVFNIALQSGQSKEVIRERVTDYLNEQLNPFSGRFLQDNDDFVVCSIVDYINVKSTLFSVFAMYMTYNLLFEYSDNLCKITIGNISYVEKESFEMYEKATEYEKSNMKIMQYSAEDIMLQKNYKLLMFKRASERVTTASLKRINGIIRDIDLLIYR